MNSKDVFKKSENNQRGQGDTLKKKVLKILGESKQ